MFVQVYNHSAQALPAATAMTISDTQGNVYTPIVPEPDQRLRLPRRAVPAKGQLPAADTTAALGPTQGALLLYKIQVVSLDNRPLELKITNPATRPNRPRPSSTSERAPAALRPPPAAPLRAPAARRAPPSRRRRRL